MEKIFICYTQQDVNYADRLCNALEKENFSCWMQSRDVAAGLNRDDAIKAAIRDCGLFVVLVSAAAGGDNSVTDMTRVAFENDRRIVPFMLQDMDYPDSLMIHLVGLDPVAAYPTAGGIRTGIDTLVADLSGEARPRRSMRKKQPPARGRKRLWIGLTAALLALAAVLLWIFLPRHVTLEYPDGSAYEGWVWLKEHHGQGKLIYEPSSQMEYYDGQWESGLRSGTGTLVWKDGDTYTGDWHSDLRHGFGTYTTTDGDRYTGQWQNGKMHGEGTYTWSDGDTYAGQYANGKRNGEGTFTWADGQTYTGSYVDGAREGQGTMIFAPDDSSGRKSYVGQWKNNERHGTGTMAWTDGAVYEGEWVNGNFEGKGIYVWPDGDFYDGEWQDDKRHGLGVYTWAEGTAMQGPWVDGEAHGEFLCTKTDGSLWTRIYENGEMISEEEI